MAADVRRHAAALPENDGRGALAGVVLREADGRLSVGQLTEFADLLKRGLRGVGVP